MVANTVVAVKLPTENLYPWVAPTTKLAAKKLNKDQYETYRKVFRSFGWLVPSLTAETYRVHTGGYVKDAGTYTTGSCRNISVVLYVLDLSITITRSIFTNKYILKVTVVDHHHSVDVKNCLLFWFFLMTRHEGEGKYLGHWVYPKAVHNSRKYRPQTGMLRSNYYVIVITSSCC